MLREERPCPTVRHLTSAFGAQCKGVAARVVVALDGSASGAEILRSGGRALELSAIETVENPGFSARSSVP